MSEALAANTWLSGNPHFTKGQLGSSQLDAYGLELGQRFRGTAVEQRGEILPGVKRFRFIALPLFAFQLSLQEYLAPV